MKSLSERFADRAQRKAENAAESNNGTNTSVGAAMVAIGTANDLVRSLGEEDKRLVMETMRDSSDGFDSLAEDDTGNFKYAGIGIVNPLVVPPSDASQAVPVEAAEVQAGAGWGTGNANGRAVEEQAGDSSNGGAASETEEEIAKRQAAEEVARLAGQKGTGKTTVIPKAKS